MIGSLSQENQRLRDRYGRQAREVLGEVEEAVGLKNVAPPQAIESIREYWNNINIEAPEQNDNSMEM